jgi:hypothetical protein
MSRERRGDGSEWRRMNTSNRSGQEIIRFAKYSPVYVLQVLPLIALGLAFHNKHSL